MLTALQRSDINQMVYCPNAKCAKSLEESARYSLMREAQQSSPESADDS
jgi:hypothetical protein